MKTLLPVIILAACAIHGRGEPAQRANEAPRGWLGLQVSKPDETIVSHLPMLPPGIGFVVRAIDKDGPAEAAGLREFDIIWKIGDQMLVNEAQLAALLRLSKPGDSLVLSGFRSGKPLDFTLKLGEAPASRNSIPGELVDAAIFPGDIGGPMRVINVSEKLASYSNDEGSAELRKQGSIYHLTIHGPKGELIHDGPLSPDGTLNDVPEKWQRRVGALHRGLTHALEGNIIPVRQPRPRVLPPARTKS